MEQKVELVRTETDDGLVLAGALLEPAGTPRSAAGVDAALLVHGSALNFYHPFVRFFAEGLAASGCATLSANNRGHDLVSRAVGSLDRVTALESIPDEPDPLFGTAFEELDDCRRDIRAWLDFLEEHGYRRILLFGHSRGAVKSCYYMAREDDRRVAVCVLASPPWFSYQRWMCSTRAELFAEHLRDARALVEAGQPKGLLRVRVPMDYLAAAGPYIDQYGPEERYNVIRLVEQVSRPVLILHGTAEVAQRFAFDGLPEAFQAISARKPNVTHVSIPDGDHLYTGREDIALDAILNWLGGLQQPA